MGRTINKKLQALIKRVEAKNGKKQFMTSQQADYMKYLLDLDSTLMDEDNIIDDISIKMPVMLTGQRVLIRNEMRSYEETFIIFLQKIKDADGNRALSSFFYHRFFISDIFPIEVLPLMIKKRKALYQYARKELAESPQTKGVAEATEEQMIYLNKIVNFILRIIGSELLPLYKLDIEKSREFLLNRTFYYGASLAEREKEPHQRIIRSNREEVEKEEIFCLNEEEKQALYLREDIKTLLDEIKEAEDNILKIDEALMKKKAILKKQWDEENQKERDELEIKEAISKKIMRTYLLVDLIQDVELEDI